MAAETINEDAEELLKTAVDELLSIARALQQGPGVESERVVLSEEPLPEALYVEATHEAGSASHDQQPSIDTPEEPGYGDIIPGMLVTNAIQGLLYGIHRFGMSSADAIARGVFNVAEALAARRGREEDIVMYLEQVLEYLENSSPELAGTPLHFLILYRFAAIFKRRGLLEKAKRALYSAQRIADGSLDMAIWGSLIYIHKELGEQDRLLTARMTFLQICEPRLAMPASAWPDGVDYASFVQAVGRTCFEVGLASRDMGRLEDGIDYLTGLLRKSSEAAPQAAASHLLSLAECYHQHPALSTGQHASLILLEQAIAGYQRVECTCSSDPLHGNWWGTGVIECGRHQHLADALQSLGIVQENQGFMEEAQRSFERGLQLVEECHDVDREAAFHASLWLTLLLKSHLNVAFGLQRLEDIPDLTSLRYKPIFDHCRKLLKKTRPGVSVEGDTLAIYARALLNPPEDFNKATHEKLMVIQECMQVEERRGFRSGRAFHHQNMSVHYLRIRDIEGCKRHLSLALKSLEETPISTELSLQVLQPLGWVALDAEILDLDCAYEIWQKVYRATEEMLENMARISEEHAFRYFEISKHACMALAKCQMYRSAKVRIGTEAEESALIWAERGKGRMLMSFVDVSTQSFDDPASHFDKNLFLTDDIFALKFICNRLPASPALVSQTRKTVFVEFTFLDYENLMTQIVIDGPGPVSTLLYSSTISLRSILSDETRHEAEICLNAVQIHSSEEGTQSFMKTVTFQQATRNVLSAMNKYSTNRVPFNPWIPGMVVGIQKHVGEAIAKLSVDRNSLLDKELDKIAELFQALYAVLIKPIKEQLAAVYKHGRDTLVFVPHEDLGIVPFAALHDAEGSPRYLIEDYAISVSPSIWCTRHCEYLYEKIVRSGYEDGAVPVLVGKKSGYPPGYQDLQQAHEEVDAVAAAIGRSTVVTILKDDELSHARMMEVLPNASWIHLSVHGEVSSQFPQGSLLFSDDDSQRLTAEQIMTVAPSAWRARAVILSACQTGLGPVAGGGIMGFARSFILAGVPSSVLSMWQAEERFCTEFMQRLYEQLASGYSLAYAVQEVTKSMVHEYKKGRRRKFRELKWSILHWACFTCVGFPSVVLPNTEVMPPVDSN